MKLIAAPISCIFRNLVNLNSCSNQQETFRLEMAAESSVEYTLLNDVDTAVKTEMTPSVDENGDQIILEAECNKNSLYRQICLIVVLSGSLFALVFCLPLFLIINFAVQLVGLDLHRSSGYGRTHGELL